MKYGIICFGIFVTCEIVGVWQAWTSLMVIGGGWLVFSVILVFTSLKERTKKR